MTTADVDKPKTKSVFWRRIMPIVILLSAGAALGTMLFPSDAGAPVQPVRVVNSYPHDARSFSQGLVMHKGGILEGTGHYGESRLRLLDVETGTPSVDIPLPANEFGEGVTVWQNTILQLTWKRGYIIQYDANTMARIGTIPLRRIDSSLRQGWGITHDGTNLIISDGSQILRFVDPTTFRLRKRIRVRDGRQYVPKLNELEFINGEIFANVWYRDQIARIDPETGMVNSWLELKPLRPAAVKRSKEAVLNGIAWDAQSRRLFVTGKNWPTLYEIEF